MNTLLDRILAKEALELAFQPIIERHAHGGSSVFAFECLSRGPRATNARDAVVLFEYVRRKRAERVVDRLCVSKTFEHAHALAPYDITVNVHGSTLAADPKFSHDVIDAAARTAVDPRNVIIEVVEQCGILNDVQFRRSVSVLHEAGFRFAIDDFGMGHSNFKMVLECRPEIIKIDRYFSSGVATDNARAAVVESIIELASRLGARVIAEGVESRQVEGVLHLLGVELFQGYLYAPPLSLVDVASFVSRGGSN